ncbi:MAG: electron transport complex subunit RsxC [Hyphomicrobiales bacterium]|nr:MAG: electron transport complex subunit RsxC [Hyphomicrobiales bacterium]
MGFLKPFLRASFRHGIHPDPHKGDTASRPIQRFPFPDRLVLHLDQNIGKPSLPIVKKGQEVVRGEPVAVADDFVSVPLHSPATGIVRGIELMPTARGPKTRAILIDVYHGSTQEVLYSVKRPLHILPRTDLLRAIQETGMVGLGGAAFPTHVKMTLPPGQEYEIHTLVVNGAECEPFLTTDHRVMLEQTEDLIRGVRYALEATEAKQAIIGIEDNKMDAVHAVAAAIEPDDPITVQAVPAKYPQGAEKMLIRSLLGLEVPPRALPASVGVVVSNVGTLAQLGYLLPRGEGLIERVITVTGAGIKRPGNYRVPIGTPIRFLLEEVGFEGEAAEIILGGPMMGMSASSLDTPVTKGMSGILVLNEKAIEQEAENIYPCIKCARCVQACPMYLNPSEMGQLAAKREYEQMESRFHLTDCFECGCCSYVCPSNIPLVQYFRIAKAMNREKAKA